MKNHSLIPTICIVGRPNVGKSSLLNCLLKQRRAVVVDEAGTTRDRMEVLAELDGITVKFVDTGGYSAGDRDDIARQVKEHIYFAMEEASVILLVADTIAGITAADEEIARMLRKFNKPVIMVANKTDNAALGNDALEFYNLGYGDPEAVSCLHRKGISGLKKRIRSSIEISAKEQAGEETRYLKIAVVGRPNVGKSSFINNLLARERVIVSDLPGTTRDSIDTHFNYGGSDYILIDTAGIRHKRKVKTVVDTFSMMRSREAIRRADVTVLLLDAADGATKDDISILGFIEESGKACVLLINKWDLAEETDGITEEEYIKHLIYASSQLGKYPIIAVSSKTGKNVARSMDEIKALDAALDNRFPTPLVNRIFEKNDPSNVPVSRKKKRPNFLYVVQSGYRPMEFKYFVNDPAAVQPAHLSYIENQLRANLPLKGVPVRIIIQRSRRVKR